MSSLFPTLSLSLSDFTSRRLTDDVLGAVLNGRLPSVVPFLQPEHFPTFREREIWNAMLQMEQEGQPIDIDVLAERLKHTVTLEPDINWFDYLIQIIAAPWGSSSLSLEALAEVMLDNWRRWKICAEALDFAKPLPPDENAPLPPARRPLTVAEILSAEIPAPRGPWKGVIPPGLTILGARPKSGKSLLMMQLAIALGSGGMHFGQRVEKRKVLYYSLEDKEGRLQPRLRALRAPADASVEFVKEIEPLHQGGLESVTGMIDKQGYGLVIIDTIERAMPGVDFVKDAAKYGKTLGALQSAALERNVSVVGIVHRRKGQSQMRGDPIDDVLGTTQMTTAADCVLCIYPQARNGKKKGPRRANLLGRARDLDDIDLWMAFDPSTLCWQPCEEEGEEEERAQTEAQEQVLEVIKELGKANAKMVSDALGGNTGTIWRRLQALWKAGQLERETIGKSFYYFLSNHNGKKEEPGGQLHFIQNAG